LSNTTLAGPAQFIKKHAPHNAAPRAEHLSLQESSMSENFLPTESIDIYCRFCQKVMPAKLDRSIAENGKSIDRASTFEYSCTKCLKTFCFSGNDLPARATQPPSEELGATVMDYLPTQLYLIGQVIRHTKFEDTGTVVNKDSGVPSRILVKFEKTGLKKLVEGLS
jgi:hypothetical protein